MIKPSVVDLCPCRGEIVLTGAKVLPLCIIETGLLTLPSFLQPPAQGDSEEIFTIFNTIYSVLCELRKP